MAWEVYIPPREKTRQLREIERVRFRKDLSNGSYRRYDYGREHVYRCERNAESMFQDKIFDCSLAEIERMTKDIFADTRVIAIDPYPGENVIVEDTWKDGACAYSYQRRMRFGTMKNNITVLHEIAHVLTPADRHGREFVHVFCMLIGWFIGTDEEQITRKAFGI